ncbi:uL15 family ribosomal protein [Patescibacteria group bacterium]|nr:uL15 family ribosomal protein [Patescibacteria group bacterium]
MQLHQLSPNHKLTKKKRVGRGGKRGTYSGKGMKGQKSRAGTHKFAPIIRELIKKYPKLKGYRNLSGPKDYAIINLNVLEANFKENEVISPKILLEKKLIRRIKGRTPKVKILGDGQLTKKLIIENCDLSKKAQEKIKK